jgi:septal ring factor EnvC (AmiA/AmiB activator)
MGYCKPFKRGVSWRSQNFGANATIYGPHSGNDDAAPIGTPVHAAGDGYIEWAGEFDDTYLDNLLWLLKMGGNIAVLNCGANAPSFVYGHMDSFTVKRGDWVRKGQVIGYSGNTGSATTGAHLHTEAIPPGYALNSPMLGRVNPDIYLTEWPEDINTGSLTYASESVDIQEDDMAVTPSFEPNVRASLQKLSDTIGPLDRDLRAAFDTVTEFQRDVRATFDVVRAQNEAQAATIAQLVGLLAAPQGLDAQAIIDGVTNAIADRVKITATIDGGEAE